MKVKKTVVKVDCTLSIRRKTISLIEVEDIEVFVKTKEDSIGTRGIHSIMHEICNGFFHKLIVHQNNLDPFGNVEVEKAITYEWKG